MKKSVIRIHYSNTHYDYVNKYNKKDFYEYNKLAEETGKGKIKTDLDFIQKQLKKKEGMLEFPKSDPRCLGSTNQIIAEKVKDKNVFFGIRISEIEKVEVFNLTKK